MTIVFPITFNQIELRAWTLKDAKAVFAYRGNKESNKFQGWIPQSVHEVEEKIKLQPKTFNKADTWYQLVITDKNSKAVLGDIGLHFLSDGAQVEIGCTLAIEHQGKGIATKCLKQLINLLFNQLGKHRIMASIDPQNTASENMLKRLNFRKEAHFKQSIYLNGEWVDDVVFALLRTDFI